MPRKKPAPQPAVACPRCRFRADPGAGPLNFCPECGADLRPADEGTGSALLQKVVADRYRLLAVIGEGGMGTVYKAEHIRMGKALALKILRPRFAREEGAVERFRAEARIVSRLSHPHTIAVFDFGEVDDGGFYLAMEYVQGKDLARLLREAGRLPEARVARIGAQILGSLAEAHDAGIVHRDIKPANVMLMPTRSGEDFVKVLDFGIAKLRDAASATAPDAAESTAGIGAIVGTPNYLAPEQARGDPVDGRADLYAVGCLLYELAAGHPPFRAPSPVAVITAHLHQAPPPLPEEAPGSRRLAAVIERALAKAPADRFASADEMAEALSTLGETTGALRLRRAAAARTTGELELARREDFADLERHLRPLRRGRVVGPLLAVAAALAAGVAWRWADVYALAAARLPAAVALLPEALRPSGHWDGAEHEPNDVPARAQPLPIPPGPDGAPGAAVVRGSVGARRSEAEGDVDIYRLEVPPAEGRRVLVAEWRGERPGEGIRGLDVALALNRLREEGPRATAPLVVLANRGGPGRPERLVAAVEAGTYFLAVREVHEAATGPVEKPTDRYLLEVRLAAPRPDEEVEPDDGPDRLTARFERYAAWRAVAARNPLGEAALVHGDTAPDDPDVYAVAPRGPGEAPALVAAIPDPALALTARLWLPDDEDLGPPRDADRVRFASAGEGGPGEVLVAALPAPPRAGAPAVLELHAASGAGRYAVLALGEGAASGERALAAVRRLAEEGRPAAALVLAAGYAGALPGGAGRAEVLLAAGRVAEGLALELTPEAARAHERAGQLLGAPPFEVGDGGVAYRGAFEAEVRGAGRTADEAALRLVALAAPCTPEDVATRAAAFLARTPAPAPDLAAEARLVHARALEDAFWASGGEEPARLAAAVAAWKALTGEGSGAGEAAARVAALGGRVPSRRGARPACR